MSLTSQNKHDDDGKQCSSDNESSSSSSIWSQSEQFEDDRLESHTAEHYYNTRSRKRKNIDNDNNDAAKDDNNDLAATRSANQLRRSKRLQHIESPQRNSRDEQPDQRRQRRNRSEANRAASLPTKSCEYCKSQIPADATRCRYCQATLEIVEQMAGEGFIVMKRRRAEAGGDGYASESVSVRIVDDALRKRLQRILRYETSLMSTGDAELSLAQLFAVRDELRADPQSRERTFLAELLRFLDTETRHLAEAFAEMKRHGLVSFTMLPHAFPIGTLVYGWHQRRLIGMCVTAVDTVSNVLSASVVVRGEVVFTDGSRLLTLTHRIVVPQYDGLVRLDSLPVRLMTDDILQRLKQRGARFRQYALGHQFLEYRGLMLRRGASRAQNAGEPGAEAGSRQDATGRVMIDGAAMRRMQPNYPFTEASFYRDESEFFQEEEQDRDEECEDDHVNPGGAVSTTMTKNRSVSPNQAVLADDRLFCTWPTVCGFSFRLKKWGEFYVDALEPVRWNSDSFDKLVLPDEHRRLVSALVTQVAGESLQKEPQSSDIVANKGRGCVVLLHGPPGTGKTTTAETVAEHLRLPLYVVSAGELGVTADQLQKRLRSILDLCAVWRSIVLVDEADAFLARRSTSDVSRNALVCVFLRMLEYHSGILFLTTNRMRDFDEAFFSRVHLALPYAPLDVDARLRIWRTMLAMTGMRYSEQQIDLQHLASLALNGRQIRTVVRLATMLAKDRDYKNGVSMKKTGHGAAADQLLHAEDFSLPLRHLQQFESDIVSNTASIVALNCVEVDDKDIASQK
jgi:hypothetical protein